jgi:SAM-dependent methyltransferase/glycosyltransferase involved in cell wall biosynthesis
MPTRTIHSMPGEGPDAHNGAEGPAERSAAYWKNVDGHAYELLVRSRQQTGAAAYQQQERVLAAFITAERDRRGGVIDVLEFGCGYGRHARYLSGMEGVRYHGYDFSEGMTEPLRRDPPPALLPVTEHLFVGPDVAGAVGSRRFDVVFTVSVLIHNPPERAQDIVRALRQLVKPGGAICLIENQLVPFSLFENLWHEGCWLHDYVAMTGEGWDVHLGHGLVDTHDVYVLRRATQRAGRVLRLDLASSDAPVEISRSELAVLSLPKLQSWATSAQHVLASGNGGDQGRLADLEEQVRALRQQSVRHRELGTVADVLATIRFEQRRDAPRASKPSAAAPPGTDPVLWNVPLDTAWANVDPRFARVVHVVHQEWHGIRASAGYSPGHKLAIVADRPMSAADHRRAIEHIVAADAEAVVLHGYSDNAEALVKLLRRALGRESRIVAAWHGSTAQFHVEFERRCFERLMRLLHDRVLDGLACVKPGMDRLSDLIFPQVLLCMPPRPREPRQPRESISGEVLVPVPNDWRKNFYTNFYAAACAKRVRTVHVTTDFVPVALTRRPRVVRWARPGREQVLRLMHGCDAVLNASLSECQPMTLLEGAVVGTPCLTGPLALAEFADHPFARVAQVPHVDNVVSVARALDGVLDLRERSPRELAEMMSDYVARVTALAIQRYGELLRL